MYEFLLRSLMFVPGHNEKLMTKAASTEADVLLLDLEDSVQPFENKKVARSNIKKNVEEGLYINHHVFPRINDRESGELLKDVHELSIEGVDGFMYPKAKKGEDIYFIDKLLETIEYEKQLPIGKFKLIPLIETAAAVLNVQEICHASDRVIAIAYGCEDFISDLQGIHDKEGNSLFVPRAIIAMGARANGVVPIDTVHIDVHNYEDLEKNLKTAYELGFEGMLVLSPKELPYVHRIFSPSEEEVNEAEEIIRLSDEAAKENKGVAIVNDKFIGPPMVLKANSILRKHEMIVKSRKS
jgi:citrate lyase subunit beta/citryl-CoA lyase